MSPHPDVLIVGGGVIGASIAFHLATAGVRRVMLCEQDIVPGLGATLKSGGLIRMHHTNPWQAQLAWQSYSVYNHWADVVGGDCGFRQTTFALIVGPEHISHLEHNTHMLRELGIPFFVLTPDEFRTIQPFYNSEGVGAVVYEPFSGYADPALSTLSLLNRARQHGLELIQGAQITGLIARDGRITGVQSNFGEIHAGTVIVAASFWATRMLKEVGVTLPLRPRRLGNTFLRWPGTAETAPLCTYIDDITGTYFRAEPGGRVLVGIKGRDWDNGALVGPPPPVQQDEMEAAQARVQTRLPLLRDAQHVSTIIGCDSYTPDEHALIGRVDELDGLYLAVGFSGGGFKIAPAVGQAVATEITSTTSVPELEPFRPNRFAAGRPIKATHPYQYM